MDTPVQETLPHSSFSGEARWITASVALFATAVFTVSAVQVVPRLVTAIAGGEGLPPELATTFLLNIALLLFAWRRSVQLKDSFVHRHAAELRIHHLAYHDEVTGLYNRRHLHVAASELLVSGEKDVALLLLDLDQFKGINDLYGHEVGDAVLVATAETILASCTKDDCCVRLGGDEFAVLLHGQRARGRRPLQLAEKLLEELAEPVRHAGAVIAVGASIGLASLQGGSRELRWLLRRADLAMYEAKSTGRNRCVEFDEQMEVALGVRAAL